MSNESLKQANYTLFLKKKRFGVKIKVLQLIEHALFKFAKRRLQLKTVSPQKSPLEVEI